MPMLRSIELGNFKTWRELPSSELRSVTGLVGVNSAGKSSVIQSLLLLKQTAESCVQPGLGHAFLIHLDQNQFNRRYVLLVPITEHHDRGFVEFPSDPDLSAFDKSDRKFVAVALASPVPHEIANAVDSNWGESEAALRRNGVVVKQLCAVSA